MTPLTKPISRETRNVYRSRSVIVTLAPARGQPEALIGFRLKGTRVTYVCTVSDLFRIAALWHGQQESAARRKARRDGVPWRIARRAFLRSKDITGFNAHEGNQNSC